MVLKRVLATAFLLALAACGQEAATQDASAAAHARDEVSRARPQRTVALTFDDLPGVFLDTSVAHARAANERLIASLGRATAHATGFVNEDKLRGTRERASLLELWLDRGLDLGNHTWGHPDLHRVSLADYQAAVLRGDSVTRRLMSARGAAPRFFRHTFLHTGRDTAIERFLGEHGYRVAPVTIDNYDYLWARAYDRALLDGDSVEARRIGDDYVAYMDTVFGFYEAQSRALFGRGPAGAAAAREHAERRSHGCPARDDAAARLRRRSAGNRARGSDLRVARRLHRRRGHDMAASLGDHTRRHAGGVRG